MLAAWTASPARLREDANAEQDLALGGHRDRLVVELAQNAADAAARAAGATGQAPPGRLLLRLDGDTLLAANTGAPLDEAGVEALSTLRASAKRDQPASVGRFGVGFAAVLTVTDAPRMLSRTGSVGWSAEATSAVCASVRPLATELAAREGHVPVLRLPWPVQGSPPDSYDTAVVLPLRDAAAVDVVRRQLRTVDAVLLLALPALGEVVVEVDGTTRRLVRTSGAPEGDGEVVLTEDGRPQRWVVVRTGGPVAAELLADRPVEERARPWWSVGWAVRLEGGAVGADPLGGTGALPQVVHAPTPTDEPLDLPALLFASFPLDPARRRVAAGPLTDALVGHAAQAYAQLARLVPDPIALVPGPVAVGALDAVLRRRVLEVLAETPLLAALGEPDIRLRGRDAVAVEGAGPALLDVLAPVLGGLVADRGRRLSDLGVRRLALVDVVDLLASLDRAPSWWRGLYAALAAQATSPEAFGALPVPLADGRLVRGARGALLLESHRLAGSDGPEDSDVLDPSLTAALGLRVVHPDAAHPLLLRLGGTSATPRTVLEDPAVRAAVERSLDDALDLGEPGWSDLVEAVLAVVQAARPEPGELAWLGSLALPDGDGEPVPAGELLLPDAALREVVDPEALGVVDAALVQRWGRETLTRVGVLAGFAVVRDTDVLLDPDACDHDLDAEDEWVDAVLAELAPEAEEAGLPVSGSMPELLAVRDLDLVEEHAWPRALALLAEPGVRDAVVRPQRVLTARGGARDVRSYTAWWLSRHRVLGGARPLDLRDPAGDPRLEGLWDDATGLEGLDAGLVRALGVRSDLDAVLTGPDGVHELLDRLADTARTVPSAQLPAVHAVLAALDPARVDPPSAVRVGGARVVPAADAVVLDAPDLAALLGPMEAVPVPLSRARDLAEVLDLPLASEEVGGEVLSTGVARAVPPAALAVVPGCPRTYLHHERLVVAGVAAPVAVTWRVVGGRAHASSAEGLARALAWSSGAWAQRLLLGAVLAEPDRVGELLAERGLEG